MNVILLDSVENLGAIGDMVTVKAGYGRNYLLPTGKAALATKDNIAEFESRRGDLEKASAEEVAAAKARAELVQGMELIIPANVGAEGKLFGSVGPETAPFSQSVNSTRNTPSRRRSLSQRVKLPLPKSGSSAPVPKIRSPQPPLSV